MNELIKNLDLHATGLWLPVTIVIILILLVIFIPKKHIYWNEIYMTFGIIGFVTWIFDEVIARQMNLLDLGNPSRDGIGDFLSYCFVPSSLSCLYLNFYNGHNKRFLIPIFVAVSLFIERSMIQVGYMHFHGWHSLYSFIFYVPAFGNFLPLHLKIIRQRHTTTDE